MRKVSKHFLRVYCVLHSFTDTETMASLGNWIAATPIPDQSLESRETRLEGKAKELLLGFVRRILCWLPEERPTARDMLEDEFFEWDFSEDEQGTD